MSSTSGPALATSLARGQLIGTFLGLILYGVTCLQAFFYFQTYVHDRRGLKLTVALVLALESVHAALTMWVMDNYLIAHYADEMALESANWLSSATYIIGFLTDFLVYIYFTWRIWSFTERIYVVVLMSSISTSRTAISILACVLSVRSPSWASYLEHTKPLILTGNTLFIIGDLLSASVMVYHLNKRKSGMRRMDLLINRLLIFTVGTGALTCLVDIIALILTVTQPSSLSFLAPILVQTRLYANSLLTSLNVRKANSRAYENARNSQSEVIDLPVISLQFARPPDLSAVTGESDHQITMAMRKSTAESWHTAQASGASSRANTLA